MIAGITEKEQKIIERILDKYRKDYAFFYYGSRVKGTYEKTSDLDVLIKGKAEMPLAILQEIKEEFDDSDLPYIVNFSDYYKLDSSFYERIKPDLIPYNWQEVKLGDVCSIIDGDRGVNYPKEKELQKNGYCLFLNTKNVPNSKFDFSECSFISKEKDEILRKGKIKYGDIVVTTRGTLANFAYYSKACKFENIRINSGMVILRNEKQALYTPYLCHFLMSNKFKQQVIMFATGSAQPQLPIKDMKNITIPLPPLEVQKKIAGVLGALDDKIELNNKINQNLEAQAQALFKSWFVDFEPFGGKMPDDWKIKTIGDVCASISETYNRKDENVVLINTSDVLNGEILTHTLVKNENLKGQFKKTFQKNDILYSEIRPINKRFAFVDIENTYNYIASTKLMVIRPDTSKISPLILYRILKSQDLIDELQHLAETRSGTFPQITFASELAIQKIVLAPLNEQKRISNVLEVLENKIRKNIQENLRLAELRDALLPKLMSGEINVDNVKID